MRLERGPLTPQSTGGPGITRFATRGEHRLSYESSGDRAAIPVLALHDLLADRGQLRPLAEPPHDALFRLTLPDARGHGASPMLSGRAYPPSELAADALAVLDAEGLPSAHLVAIGWAAATALFFAASAPPRVASLVLAGPYLPGLAAHCSDAAARQTGSVHLEMMQEAADLAEKGQMDRALDLFLGARIGTDWRDRFSKPRLGAIRRSAGNLAPLLAGTVGAPIDPGALKSLDMPVVLLVKEDAEFLERGTVEALASLVPHARIATVPPQSTEQPASGSEWTEAIVEVLGSAPPLFPARMPSPNI
jgi:pimeloyl-ACP methyl ester carboxylesterase